MTLKQKSLLISLTTAIIFLSVIILIVNRIISVRFQQIENQRVERNIRRITAILDDRFVQIDNKLADWANWDDTYQFIQDNNTAYIKSNLIPENFANIGIDKALFIDNKGNLIASISSAYISVDENGSSEDDLYRIFAPGSTLTTINPGETHNQGLLRTNDGLLFYVVRNIIKSDGTGSPKGIVIFARYLDDKILNSVKNLTQFEAQMYLWDDPNLPPDFQKAKNNYLHGENELINILDSKTISGYITIEDVYGKAQAIVRSDIERDISTQGKSSILLLIYLLICAGVFVSAVNYLLLTKMILGKVTLIAKDVETLGESGKSIQRLKIGNTSDEVDKLRLSINEMLDSLNKSKKELTNKEQFIDVVMDNLDIGIAVNQISTGKAIYMNKAFEDTYGWTKDFLTSVDTFFEKVYPDEKYRTELKKKVLSDISSGDSKRMQWENLEITKSDGKKRFVNARNIPLSDQDLMVSTVIDVTETKQSTDERNKYTEELERLNELMVNRELKMVDLKKQLEKEKDK